MRDAPLTVASVRRGSRVHAGSKHRRATWGAALIVGASATLVSCGGLITDDIPAERLGATGGTGSDPDRGERSGDAATGGDDGLSAPPAICPGLPLAAQPSNEPYCLGWTLEDGPAPCEAVLPPPPDGSPLDPDLVRVRFVPSSGPVEEIPPLASLDACRTAPNGGVHLDAAEGSLTARVCPCTCARFGRDALGQLEIEFACAVAPELQ
jgi:hypothetical protein